MPNVPLVFNRRHPAILRKYLVVNLIIRYYHEKCLHGATQLTLSQVRQCFWVLKSRQLVKSVIFNCVQCARLKAAVAEQLMGALSVNRTLRPSRPFSHVSIDYARPLKIRLHRGRGHASHSAYAAVFVCFAVRANRLEAASDYTSEAFVAALKLLYLVAAYQTQYTVIRRLISKVHSAN